MERVDIHIFHCSCAKFLRRQFLNRERVDRDTGFLQPRCDARKGKNCVPSNPNVARMDWKPMSRMKGLKSTLKLHTAPIDLMPFGLASANGELKLNAATIDASDK